MKFFINWLENQQERLNKMRQFKAFVIKEFYHILRDHWTVIILLLMPVVMTILFGFGISTEIKNTRFAVYDPSRDHVTQGIINKLSNSEYFIFDGYISNPEQIENLMAKSECGLVIVFSNKFGQRVTDVEGGQVQIITDGSDPNTASILTGYASNLIMSYQNDLNKQEAKPSLINADIKLIYNPSLKNVYNTVPGIIGVIIILICAIMTSVSITREKENGTMEVLLVSPMKPILIILSKVIPYFCISLINLTTILLLSHFLLGVPIRGSLLLVIFISLIYIFVSLSFGILISTLVDKQIVALLISGMVLMLPVVYFSGMIFPIESFPLVLQWLANIIPAKWFIIAMKNVMIKGMGFTSVLKEIIILSSMAVIIIAISIKKFKIRLE